MDPSGDICLVIQLFSWPRYAHCVGICLESSFMPYVFDEFRWRRVLPSLSNLSKNIVRHHFKFLLCNFCGLFNDHPCFFLFFSIVIYLLSTSFARVSVGGFALCASIPFRFISVYFELVRPISVYFWPFLAVSNYLELFRSISVHFWPFHTILAHFGSILGISGHFSPF